MAERLYCAKGHSWTPAFPPDVWPPDFRSSCPVCGEGPIGPNDVTGPTARVMVILAAVFVLAGLPMAALSEHTLPFGVISLILGGVIAIGGLLIRSGRKKVKMMASVADAMGFSFMAHLTQSSIRAVAPFQLFKLGHAQKACNAMQGRVGDCDVLFFEYQYTTGSGKSSQTTFASAVIVFDGAAGVPEFQVAPRTIFDKMVNFFTHSAIEIPDAGLFTSRCKLSGPDPGALRETFHPDLVDYLGRDGKWFLQAVDDQLLVYRTPLMSPDRCPGLVTDALEIRDLLRGAGRRAS